MKSPKPSRSMKLELRLNNILRPMRVLPPEQAYDLWAETYDERDGNAVLLAEERAVLPLLDMLNVGGKAIIDIGCGTGRHIGHILDRGAQTVVGVDSSMEMLLRASAKFQNANTTLIKARMDRLPLEDSQFDAAIASLCLSHSETVTPVLSEIARVLRQHGTLIISDLHESFHSRGWYRTFKACGTHFTRYSVAHITHTFEEYRAAFDAVGLSLVQHFEPLIDDVVRPFFERADMMPEYHRYAGEPLLVVYFLQKQ